MDCCPIGCRSIIVTGASRLGVHVNDFQMVQKSLPRAVPQEDDGCHRPVLEFGLLANSFQMVHESLARAVLLEGGGWRRPELQFDLGSFTVEPPMQDFSLFDLLLFGRDGMSPPVSSPLVYRPENCHIFLGTSQVEVPP